MIKKIPHNKPTIGQAEEQAVRRVLKSGWVAQGPEVEKFENEFCVFLKQKKGQAVAVSSGTSALYITLASMGIGKGDEVITPTYVCSAVLNAINLTGAAPVLVDINEDDLNLSFAKTRVKVNKKTKAIILTHTYGLPAELNKFLKLKVPIIEDCAQAVGAKYNGRLVGTFGQASIFSFYGSKMLTTGYGGMIFSKDKNFIKKVRDFREFDGRRDYKLRFNFQMSDIQAAMGRVQLKKLKYFVAKRKSNAAGYYQALKDLELWPSPERKKDSNFYRFLIRTKKAQRFIKQLEDKGVKTIVPIENFELLHRYLKQSPKNFPVSEIISKTTVSLPIYPSLSSAQIDYICKTINKIYG
ncbi:DegT/DnrJ/EryC1/StrS family aminotransferase [Candidatus Falkowbacteria bacterium]|nr:DegT/DnrJ/EryC1/StrS family aminotransferase [Candidatus Falkowbacteria bacterium]